MDTQHQKLYCCPHIYCDKEFETKEELDTHEESCGKNNVWRATDKYGRMDKWQQNE